jgi:integrase
MQERVPVPITAALVALLREEAKGRPSNAPLLTRSNGEPWGYRRSDRYRKDFAAVVAAVGLDSETTLYALRHSCISRSLLRGMPVTLLADLTDTSEREIRKHYAKLIAHHGDELARRVLLDMSQPSVANVVALPPGRRA